MSQPAPRRVASMPEAPVANPNPTPIRLFEGLELILGDGPGPVLQPLPTDEGPRFSLAELADQEAMAYSAWGNDIGRLFGRVMADLASKIRLTGAHNVADYEARIELLEEWATEARRPASAGDDRRDDSWDDELLSL